MFHDPPSVSQISAEVFQSRLRRSVSIPQRAAHGDAHHVPAAGSKINHETFAKITCMGGGETPKTHLNDYYLSNSARRQTRQRRRHRSRRLYLPERFGPIRNNVIIGVPTGRSKF